ncbi:ferrous iron transport protein A [Paucibacter sp. DJ2R-2]|uniref:FeoA family protein n=1 Tax=Paucibacter sp. DJ2R-2 TaxID=2893558 RepID=UPI0021E44B00|nr:FeoA family protein [Paucibacter sp. DJ2R-2]MCV2423163.1 ferrous iron transport protein A [Paucibacter sp. DJ4R-1]MCV2440619.1 ferrous iron transport protein A [Paucibacter sp. DJ2R-2]
MTDFSASSALPAAAGAPLTPCAHVAAASPWIPNTLAELGLGQAMQVHSVQAPVHAPEWADWLAEIGFVPGEAVKILSRGLPGSDPLVVRIGQSTFALRRAEAACIRVQALQGPEATHG